MVQRKPERLLSVDVPTRRHEDVQCPVPRVGGWVEALTTLLGLRQTHLKEKWADRLRYLERHCHFLVAQPQTDGNGGLI